MNKIIRDKKLDIQPMTFGKFRLCLSFVDDKYSIIDAW